MTISISGFTLIRSGVEFDFPFEALIRTFADDRRVCGGRLPWQRQFAAVKICKKLDQFSR